MMIIIVMIIIMYCSNNFYGKYWVILCPKLTGPPGDPGYQGFAVIKFPVLSSQIQIFP
jgi:hypothetical protein